MKPKGFEILKTDSSPRPCNLESVFRKTGCQVRTKEKFRRIKSSHEWNTKRKALTPIETYLLSQLEINCAYMPMTIDGIFLNPGESYVNISELARKTKTAKTSLIRTGVKLVTDGFISPIRHAVRKCGPESPVLDRSLDRRKFQIYKINSIVTSDETNNLDRSLDPFLFKDKLSGVVLSEFGYQWELKYSPEKFDSSANFNIQTANAVSQEMKNLYGEEPDIEHVRMVVNAYLWTNTKQLAQRKHPIGGLKCRLKSIMGKLKSPGS